MTSIRDIISKLPLKDIMAPGKHVAAIDVGSSSVKLVEVEGDFDNFSLKHYLELPLERGIVVRGLLKDPGALTDAVKTLLKKSRCRSRNVSVALSGHTVMVKKATFRKMSEEDLRDQIIDEASEYLPIDDIGKVDFDFHIVGDSDVNPENMDVVIAAAGKEVISSFRAAIEKAGCRVVIMDVDSFALETAFEENYDFDMGDVVVLVNIGATITNINILRGGRSVFTRNILQGGDAVTEALREKLDSTFDGAETIKIRGSGGADVTAEELLGYAEPILSEIERSIDYFSSDLGGAFITRVILSGGTARLPGITEAIASRLNSEVEIFNPFRKVTYNVKEYPHSYIEEISPVAALGVGLALRRLDDK